MNQKPSPVALHPARKNPAFTLIELLVVMTIVAILAALVLRTAGYVQRKAATARAETEIAALSAALESYKADHGDYPHGTNSTAGGAGVATAAPGSNPFLREALQPGSGKVYFEFPSSMGTNKGTNPDTEGPYDYEDVEDPFGEKYGYIYPHTKSNLTPTNFFLLWSRSGTTNTNQWSKSW